MEKEKKQAGDLLNEDNVVCGEHESDCDDEECTGCVSYCALCMNNDNECTCYVTFCEKCGEADDDCECSDDSEGDESWCDSESSDDSDSSEDSDQDEEGDDEDSSEKNEEEEEEEQEDEEEEEKEEEEEEEDEEEKNEKSVGEIIDWFKSKLVPGRKWKPIILVVVRLLRNNFVLCMKKLLYNLSSEDVAEIGKECMQTLKKSRSFSDHIKYLNRYPHIVEVFDKNGVSFVRLTDNAFNILSSMQLTMHLMFDERGKCPLICSCDYCISRASSFLPEPVGSSSSSSAQIPETLKRNREKYEAELEAEFRKDEEDMEKMGVKRTKK